MNDTPDTWASATPQDLASDEKHSLGIGPFGSDLKVSDYTDAGVPLIFVRNIRSERFEDTNFVAPEKANELIAHRCLPGDVLITKMGDPPGDSTIYPVTRPAGVITADCIRWRIHPRLGDPRFFSYQTRSTHLRREVSEITRGVAQTKISLARFQSIRYRVAPLPEQHRIVDAIESYFTRLDDAVATLERVQRNLKRYRASVLKAAVEGRLVPTEAELARAEGRDYEPASVLLERILAERRRRREENELAKMKARRSALNRGSNGDAGLHKAECATLPDGWTWARLDWLLREPLRNGHSAKATPDGAIRTLTLSAVTNRDFSERNTKITNADRETVRDLWLEPGDIFIERSNTPDLVGTAALYAGPRDFAIFPDLLIRVRVVPDISPGFLEAVLRSDRVRRVFQRSAQGIAGSMPKISQDTVSQLMVPVPPASEQTRIVAELDRVLAVAAQTESAAKISYLRCERLRQSILKWAFEGRLVDQDSSDEPASVLLERIKAERAASATTTSNRQPRRKGNSANA